MLQEAHVGKRCYITTRKEIPCLFNQSPAAWILFLQFDTTPQLTPCLPPSPQVETARHRRPQSLEPTGPGLTAHQTNRVPDDGKQLPGRLWIKMSQPEDVKLLPVQELSKIHSNSFLGLHFKSLKILLL